MLLVWASAQTSLGGERGFLTLNEDINSEIERFVGGRC